MREDSAPPDRISEKGWVRAPMDNRFFIPCPETFPEEHDLATWCRILAEGWLERSGLPRLTPAVEVLAGAIQRCHDGYARVPCHQMWIYMRNPVVPPLPVLICNWKMQGERATRLRHLSGADDAASTRPPDVTEFVTDHLGAGIRALHYREREGGIVALVGYAFRSEEFETDVQISAATSGLEQLENALGDIEEFIRDITVYAPGAGP